MRRFELKKYNLFNEEECLIDFLIENNLMKEYIKWRDEENNGINEVLQDE